MRTLLFSAYDTLDQHKNFDPQICVTRFEKYAHKEGFDFQFLTEGFLSHSQHVIVDNPFIDRHKCIMADHARFQWIKDFLNDYDQVIWMDADLLLLRNFKLNRNHTDKLGIILTDNFYMYDTYPLCHPPTFDDMTSREIYDSAVTYNRTNNTTLTTTIVSVDKNDIALLELIIQTIDLMSKYRIPTEWYSYGTHVMSALDNVFHFQLHHGVGFVSPICFKAIYQNESMTKKWLATYNFWYNQRGGELDSLNLSTDKNPDDLIEWVKMLDKKQLLY